MYRGRSAEGNNVESVLVRCAACEVPVYEPLDESAEYGILLPYFIANGGDRYTFLPDEIISRDDLGIPFQLSIGIFTPGLLASYSHIHIQIILPMTISD